MKISNLKSPIAGLLCLLCLLAATPLFAPPPAPRVRDIRISQFDGLNWKDVIIHPTNGTTISFDENRAPIIGAVQVWTYNPLQTAYREVNGDSNFTFKTSPYPRLIIGSNGNVTINGNSAADVSVNTPDGTIAADVYAYEPSEGLVHAVFALSGEPQGYGDGVMLDPGSDNVLGPAPFLLSTTSSNIIASGAGLFALQNAHTNKLVVFGNGDISNSTFRTSSGTLTLSAATTITNLAGPALYFGATNTPTFTAPAGSVYFGGGGGFYVRTNSAWFAVKLN